MRHRPEHQRNDQDPEGIAEAGARQRIAAKRSKRQRDRDHRQRHDAGVEGRLPEFLFQPGAFIAGTGRGGARLGQRANAEQRIAPVLTREEIGLDLEASPQRPEERHRGQRQPQDEESQAQDGQPDG